jgi:signal transduction histidine kinase
MFHLFAQLIAFHLDAQERLSTSERILSDERRTSELREQFIAVLGHDLRNPLASIDGGATARSSASWPGASRTVLALMRGSVGRMSALIDNVLDFARGRMGGGLTVWRRAVDLGPVLDHVVAELRTGESDGRIETDFSLAEPVDCDPDRIAQLASNLISNAALPNRRSASPRAATRRDSNFRSPTRAFPSPRAPWSACSSPSSAARSRPGSAAWASASTSRGRMAEP